MRPVLVRLVALLLLLLPGHRGSVGTSRQIKKQQRMEVYGESTRLLLDRRTDKKMVRVADWTQSSV